MKRYLFATLAALFVMSSSSAVAQAPAESHPIIKAVIIGGDPYLPIPTLVKHVTARPGMRYSDALLHKDAVSLRELYAAHGLELGNLEGGIDAASMDAKSDTGTLKYAVYVARIGAVRISGNADVHDATVRELLASVRPGTILEPERIKADEQRLRTTGKFRQVNVNIQDGPNPNKPEDVTLVWTLSR